MTKQDITLIRLKAQYEILSLIESEFPRGSKHAVYHVIDREITQILHAIESIEKEEKNKFVGAYLKKAMASCELTSGMKYYNLLAEKSLEAQNTWALKRKKQFGSNTK